MKPKRLLPALCGLLLFLFGGALDLSFSAVMLWGEMEARLITQQTGDGKLRLECPLMIAPWESAVIRTVVTNTLRDKDAKPQVNAFIGRSRTARVMTETLELSPLESRTLQWTVSGADVSFERAVLVNILQRPYSELPSRQGACSILVFSLFGLSGRNTLLLLAASGILTGVPGAVLLIYLMRPFNEFTKSAAQVNGIFLGLTLLCLISAFARLWGLTLALAACALLVFTTGNVEVFFHRKA